MKRSTSLAMALPKPQPFSERIYYLNPVSGAVLGSIDPVANELYIANQSENTIYVGHITL